MTDNATLRCRDEGDGESEDLHYSRGRQQIIMKDKNFCGNCKGGGSSSLGIIGTRASITHGCVFTGQTHTLVAQKGRRAGLLIPMLWKEIKRGAGGACGTTKKGQE